MVERLVGRDAVSALQLSRETGLRQQTLSRWLSEARTLPLVTSEKKPPRIWSVEEKARIVMEAGKLDGEQLTAFLARERLSLVELEKWRVALGEEGRASVATTKRIRTLERELARKEKALAEAAALLVLKKKVDSLWGDEDDDTDPESDK